MMIFQVGFIQIYHDKYFPRKFFKSTKSVIPYFNIFITFYWINRFSFILHLGNLPAKYPSVPEAVGLQNIPLAGSLTLASSLIFCLGGDSGPVQTIPYRSSPHFEIGCWYSKS